MRPAPDEHRQQELLTSGPDEQMKTLDRVMDRVNARQGRGRQQWMSPRYTTQWKDIITVT